MENVLQHSSHRFSYKYIYSTPSSFIWNSKKLQIVSIWYIAFVELRVNIQQTLRDGTLERTHLQRRPTDAERECLHAIDRANEKQLSAETRIKLCSSFLRSICCAAAPQWRWWIWMAETDQAWAWKSNLLLIHCRERIVLCFLHSRFAFTSWFRYACSLYFSHPLISLTAAAPILASICRRQQPGESRRDEMCIIR